MLAPYVDDESSGWPEWDPGELDAFVAEADARGWQVQIHAIGDAGVRMALDAYEHAAAGTAPRERPPRHRVEHVETIDRADIDQFARLGVDRVHAAVSRRPVTEPGRRMGREHRPGPGRPGVGVVVDPTSRRGDRVRLRLGRRAVRSDPGAPLGRQSPDHGGHADRRLGLRREAVAARSALGVRAWFGVRGLRRRAARDGQGGPGCRSRGPRPRYARGGPSAIIGTTVALTVVGGEVVYQTEGLG